MGNPERVSGRASLKAGASADRFIRQFPAA
jgi:hypothetical protein